MNLRSIWGGVDIPKPGSDALEYLTKRINSVWMRQHVASGDGAGLHRFPGTVVPFDPGNFGSITGGQTWTLVAADQAAYRYVDIGGWIYLYGMFAGVVAGAAGAVLTVRLPLGVRAPAESPFTTVGFCVDGGVEQVAAVAFNATFPDTILILKLNAPVWTNGNVVVRFELFWEQRPLG